MKNLLVFTFSLFNLLSVGQVSYTTLSFNNCSALISDAGFYFNDPANNLPAYEIPAGSGLNTIYSAAMWFGGTDVNSQVKLAASTYYPSTQDFWPGALTNDGAANTVVNPFGQTIWTVTKAEIEYHILNYQQPGYTMPQGILTWPAHGDISQGMSYFLAPFVDVDNDGIYDPAVGDYPCIKGDKAVYTIVNDKGGTHGSGGDPIGLEVHYMFYQYATNDFLNDITFIDVRVINRSTQTLYDYASTFWADADLGNYADDYFGCDSTRNLIYTYNGDNMDESNGGILGYQADPPAVGVMCLNQNVSSAGMFTNGAAYPYGDPANPIEYINVMHGKWLDGTNWLDNNAQPTNFLYSGNPNNGSEWSELSAGNILGDRRMLLSIEKDTPLQAFEEYELSFAVLYARDNSNLASVNKLLTVADDVQNFYDNMSDTCFIGSLGILEIENLDFNLFPNPSNGIINIELANQNQDARIAITSVNGDLIWDGEYSSTNNGRLALGVKAGVYFVTVQTMSSTKTKKLIVE